MSCFQLALRDDINKSIKESKSSTNNLKLNSELDKIDKIKDIKKRIEIDIISPREFMKFHWGWII